VIGIEGLAIGQTGALQLSDFPPSEFSTTGSSMTTAAKTRSNLRAATWPLVRASSFAEAEAQTRAYWHAATPAERLNGLETLRAQLYGNDKASQRLQRVLELVPQP